MKQNQVITSSRNEFKDGGNGYKVIEVNVTVPDASYAVCTPIKMQ
jgi:hypothetical protein